MKLFFDFEFMGLHQKTEPISIGIVSEKNDDFYAEFNDFEIEKANTWIVENVLKNTYYYKNLEEMKLYDYLKFKMHYKDEEIRYGSKSDITTMLIAWLLKIKDFHRVKKFTFVGDCLAYDWVLLNELFGGALYIPDFINYIPLDICTMFHLKNIDPDVDRLEYSGYKNMLNKHNALADAKVIKACYERMNKN